MAKTKRKTKNRTKKKSKLKQHITQVTLLSIILFTIIFFIYRIVGLIANPTDSFLVEQGIISQEESLIGYVIRDEVVIKNEENQNKLVQLKNEGDRVSVGEEVFRYEAKNEKELNKKIEDLNKQIQEAMEGQIEVPSSDIKALEKQIESKINEVQNKNSIQEIKEYKKDIDSYITKKAKISGELSSSGSYINNLISERTSIEKELRDGAKYETAPISGIVSYRIDGLEETLMPEKFEEISIKVLENLELITGQIVTTSEEEGKIINNFECYIAVSTNTEEARGAKVGDKASIRLSSNQEISAEVEYVKQEDNDVLIIFKIGQGVEYLTNYRKISVDIIWWKKEGLRVPNSSIIFENGLGYVIRNKARTIKQNISESS